MVKGVSHETLACIISRLLNSLPRNGVIGLPNLYAIDGKSRKAAPTETGKTEIDVSIYDVGTKVTVGKMVVGAKEGEAPIARELIEKLAPNMAQGYISADAGIACRDFAETVDKSGHDFIAFIKGNAGKLYDEMNFLPWQDSQTWFSAEEGHGRKETRTTKILRPREDVVSEFAPSAKLYPAGTIFGSVHRTRENLKTGERSEQRTWFIFSEKNGEITAQVVDALVRGHWCIENELHRHRDVELGEDDFVKMSVQASRVIGSILDLAGWLAGGCGRGMRYFMEQLRASSVEMFRHWQQV
jgi:predicted transposase YbfD/YdcC